MDQNVEIRVLGFLEWKYETMFRDASVFVLKGINEAILFCDYSSYDIPTRYTFRKVLDAQRQEIASGEIVLEEISQQFLKPFEYVPKGWKTICRFKFSKNIVPIINQLPIIEEWTVAGDRFIYFS